MKKLFGLFLSALLLLSACGQGEVPPAAEPAAALTRAAALPFPRGGATLFYPRRPYSFPVQRTLTETVPVGEGKLVAQWFFSKKSYGVVTSLLPHDGRLHFVARTTEDSSRPQDSMFVLNPRDPADSEMFQLSYLPGSFHLYGDCLYYISGFSSLFRRDEARKKIDVFLPMDAENLHSVSGFDRYLLWHDVLEYIPGSNTPAESLQHPPYWRFAIRCADLSGGEPEIFTVGETDALFAPAAVETIVNGYVAYPRDAGEHLEIVCYDLDERREVFSYPLPPDYILQEAVFDGRYLAYSRAPGSSYDYSPLSLYDTQTLTLTEFEETTNGLYLWGDYLIFTWNGPVSVYHIPSGEIVFTAGGSDNPEEAPRYSFYGLIRCDPEAGVLAFAGDDMLLGRTVFLTVAFPE